MKPRIYFATAVIILVLTAGFRQAKRITQKPPPIVSRESIYRNKIIQQCSPDWSQVNADSLANGIGPLPGWGNYRWNISTKNDSARFYFNQGINMYYAFHIIESMASFKKAQQFDINNAMIYWAEALAFGPNINDFEYAATAAAFVAAQKALSLKDNCTETEKGLIEAMAVRYTMDSTISRKTLNQLYATAMKKLNLQYNQDADVATLYADALMLQHPWDYWKHTGEAQPWTAEILTVLEAVLSNNPEHPGANHYYIHSVEASSNPQRALQSADKLGSLMPGVAHMIHMPSHIYIRSGNYKQGSMVNEMSVRGYNTYRALYPDVKNNVPLYLIHNLHMQSACAMMRANYNYSNKSAYECSNSFDTSMLSMPAPWGTGIQYMYMTPVINNVRFKKWDIILNNAAPPIHHIYATVLWHWATGMAFAGKNKIEAAYSELKIMQKKMKAPDMLVNAQPFNAPADAAKVAEKILEAVIAAKENNITQAIQLLNEAVVKEDALIYNEPKDWLIPAREYLGDVLLKAGKFEQAERIFKEDLKENPHNHWALYGLYFSLDKQHKRKEAIEIKKEFDHAFEGADISMGQGIF